MKGALLSVLLPISAAASGPVAGVAVSVQGTPVSSSLSKGAKPIKVNSFIYEGDTVKTGPGECVGIAFVGGAELRIRPDSGFLIENGGGRMTASVETKGGQAWARLIHGKAAMQVRTPLGAVAIRGAEAEVSFRERLLVKVYQGMADVMNPYGKASLLAGQMARVEGADQAPKMPAVLRPDEIETWQAGCKGKGVAPVAPIAPAAPWSQPGGQIKIKLRKK